MSALIEVGIGPDPSKPIRVIMAAVGGTVVMDMNAESAHLLVIDLLKAKWATEHPYDGDKFPHAFVVQT